jgi:hypothetical protein
VAASNSPTPLEQWDEAHLGDEDEALVGDPDLGDDRERDEVETQIGIWQPACAQAALSARVSSATSPTRLSDSRPAIGSGTMAMTLPSSTTQTPPPTLLATAPRFSPKSFTSPCATPFPAERPWRSSV